MVKIEEDIKLDFNDVLIKPKRSTLKSRNEVDLNRKYIMKHSEKKWEGVPIIISNMDSTGTFEMFLKASEYNIITCIHKHYSVEDWANFKQNNENINWKYLCISAGSSEEDLNKIISIIDICPEIEMICLDIANGYSEHFTNIVKQYREIFPWITLMAGNVVTAEMTEQLILAGADIIKIGIGSGSVCTTRKKTGVGCPQLSCILECADAAHGLGALVLSDGGLTIPGDFSKAFGAGADFCMSGGMFAGHDETNGDIIEENGKKYKLFYGMSSKTAQEKYNGGLKNYRSSEGKTVKIPYKGPLEDTIKDILGGIRSTCTYVGAKKLKELTKRCTFIRCNRQLNTIYGNE